jgi:heat shock protein 4
MMKREELEALVKPLLDRATQPLERALADAGLTVDDLYAVEMVGGCTRVPSVKERIAAFFGRPLSFTLNQDEAVARGCAFGCAILSPVLRVRDFAVHDLTPYGIEFSWDKVPDIADEEPQLLVFDKNNVVPCTKIMTFYRKEDFTLTASYADASALPGKTQPWVGTYTIKGVKPNAKGEFSVVKVKARLDLHGVLTISEAYIQEEREVEEVIPESELPPKTEEPKSADAEMPDADAEDAEPPKPKTRIVKKLVRTDDKLTVVSASGAMDAQTKARFQEQEVQMTLTDRIVLETEDRKNALEEHIYSVRSKLEEEWAPFASEQEKEKLNKALMDVEDWLYDEGEDTKKAKYVAKLEDLQRLAGPIRGRFFEEENKRIEAERAAREAADKRLGKKTQVEERPAVPTAEQVNVEKKKVDLEAKDYDLKDAENI